MKKGRIFGTVGVYERLISNDLIKSADLFEISELNYEFGRKNKDGDYEIVTEFDIAREKLEEGKGIVYKRYVIFNATNIENNEDFNNYKNVKAQKEKEYKGYFGGVVYDNIDDLYSFPVVKSIIELYQNSVLSEDVAINKLMAYLPMEVVSSIIATEELTQLAG